MRSPGRGATTVLAGALSLIALAPAGASAAERFYGVTKSNRLVTFQSDSPGAIRAAKPIRGLRGGEDIVGIDLRPSDSRLYGVSSASRLYTIATRTGRARAVVPAPFGASLADRSVGVDFGPGGLRLVTDSGANFRVSPATGDIVDADQAAAGIQRDGDLSYAPGDAAGRATPRVGASAYRAGRLYGIDTARDTLVAQDPPDDGSLSTVGRLGVRAGDPVGFDIGRDGRAWAAVSARAARGVGLYEIDLATGRAQLAAPRALVGTFRGRRRDPIRALTAAGRVADDRTPPGVSNRKLNDPRVSELLGGRALRLEVRCTEACVVDTQLLYRGDVMGGDAGVIRGRRGRVTLRLQLSAKGRQVVRRLQPTLLDVGIQVTDMAGNVVRTRNFRR